MREAGARYLEHQVAVSRTRRPEVIVTVTRNGRPVSDAYVYAAPVRGAISAPIGVRTDRAGTAWFGLRDPGTYRFACEDGGHRRSVTLDAPLQPLDLSHGGVGPMLSCEIAL
jgi:hypothetical protein